MREQIIGLQLEVNGGVIDAQITSVSTVNVVLTSVTATTFSVTINAVNGVPLAQNGSTYLLSNQINRAENGVYVVVGKTVGNQFILMVATTYNSYQGIMGISEAGTRLQTLQGASAGDVYVMTTTNPYVLGVTPVNVVYETNGIQNLQEQVNNSQPKTAQLTNFLTNTANSTPYVGFVATFSNTYDQLSPTITTFGNPTPQDDITQNFYPGSLWYNSDEKSFWSCLDSGIDSAVWDRIPFTGPAGGDLTGSYPNPTINTNAVSNAKLAQADAYTLKGNNTNLAGNITDLTADQTLNTINNGVSTVNALAVNRGGTGARQTISGVTYVDGDTGSDITGIPNSLYSPFATINGALQSGSLGDSLEVRPYFGGISGAYGNVLISNQTGFMVYGTGDTTLAADLIIDDTVGSLNDVTVKNIYWNSIAIMNNTDGLQSVYIENAACGNVVVDNIASSILGIFGEINFSNMGYSTFYGIQGNINIFPTGWAKQTVDLQIVFENVHFQPGITLTLNGSLTQVVFNKSYNLPNIIFANGATPSQIIYNFNEIGTVKRKSWTVADASGVGLAITSNPGTVYNCSNGVVNFNTTITYPINSNSAIARISVPPITPYVGSVNIHMARNNALVLGQTYLIAEQFGNIVSFYNPSTQIALLNSNLSGVSIQFSGSYIANNDFGN